MSSLFPIRKFLLYSKAIGKANLHTEDTISLNKMIANFSKLGDLCRAQKVFDEMYEKDTVSWNSIMTAHTQNSNFLEALRIFSLMHEASLTQNNTSFSIVLTACSKLKALNFGTQIHGLLTKLGSLANGFVATSLITMYSKCNVVDGLSKVFGNVGSNSVVVCNALISGYVYNRKIRDARKVFDQMQTPNIVSWTSIINGYIETKEVECALELFNSMPNKNFVTWCVILGGLVSNEKYADAIEFFVRMMYDGVQVSGHSIVKVISACSALKAHNHRIILDLVIKLGFHQDPIIEAALVHMFCECASIEEAKSNFDKMECKFIGSYNSLIQGYISNMMVSEAENVFYAMKERDGISYNLMISGYLKCNKIDEALILFSKMPKPTIEATTSLMHSFIQNRRFDEAQKLFDRMHHVDVVAYTTMIIGYLEQSQLEKAVYLFNRIPDKNAATYNVMISGFLHHGKITEAWDLFNSCSIKDSITWSSLIVGFVHNDLEQKAIELYKEMLFSDVRPNELIISSLLRSSSKQSSSAFGKQLHSTAVKLAFMRVLILTNSFINMYCKCGEVYSARVIFNQMLEKDIVTWNTMIHGYALNGFEHEAIEMFNSMDKIKFKPDDLTFIGVLTACNHKCLVEEARHYFTSMNDYGIRPRKHHYACMVDLFSRMGRIDEAEEVVSSMPFEADTVIWTSLLNGCKENANVELAKCATNHLLSFDPTDQMPLLQLMKTYRSVGRLDDFERVRNQVNLLGFKKQVGCSWI